MKIGILLTGHCPDDFRGQYGNYDDFFKRLLAGNEFEYATYPVLDDVFPAGVREADGWLITGSKHGVYEDLDWIARLEDFLRDAYSAEVPIVGICFGHQVLAQALGGKVEKFSGGWSVGVETYDLDEQPDATQLLAWHQDQVVEPPPQAKVVGSSNFCRYAALAYGEQAYSIQPHPEFDAGFVGGLIESRPGILPPDVTQRALDSLDIETASDRISSRIADFFRRAQARGNPVD